MLREIKTLLKESHSVPLFEGEKSSRHHGRSLRSLLLHALYNRFLVRNTFKDAHTFVQFAGFPRSGHSLIGAVLDAHPEARISHELDVTGLFASGMPAWAVLQLIDINSKAFTAAGRYWNGFNYTIEDGGYWSDASIQVLGDKKGDLAVRRIAAEPQLINRDWFRSELEQKWIAVIRNPFDNIATMSLRRGRAYDRLRQECGLNNELFRKRLRQCQASGLIASEPLDTEIAAFEEMARALSLMKARTLNEQWLDIQYEAVCAQPQDMIARLLDFLGLSDVSSFISRAAKLVQDRPSRSRTLLSWSTQNRERVNGIINDIPYFSGYNYEE